jgi:transcriptional regulator GlxA family with amidase domain
MVERRESTRGRGRRERFVLEAAEAIRREACDGLTATELAARFPVSRKHFERRFREATGHSVLDEILHIRLEQVTAYLLRRDIAIDAIAGLCGFGSEIELRRLFRRRFGMSMSEWRARNAI